MEQLKNGVRFLDVRVSVSPDDDELALVHSVFPISLTGTKYFKDMLEDIYKFLDENSSETVIMSIKREGTGKGNDEQLGKYLKHSYVDKRRSRWWTEPKIPTLGGARGRIVIVRRFNLDGEMKKTCWDGRGWGIDAGAWPDNCEDGKVPGGIIRVQDFYEITESQNIEKKIEYCRRQLERAAEQTFALAGMDGHKEGASLPPLFVNFLTASNFFNATCWPERIAAKVNPSVIEYLCMCHGEDGKGPNKLKIGSAGTGVVVTDWVGHKDDWDLIRCIVGMNARLQLKK
jgi:1-phosphatidylinositol phosphodiesterase